jgi:hypothetical protein
MDVQLECRYCGYIWEKTVYNRSTVEKEACLKCKDTNLNVRDLAKTKVNTYAGSPPFNKLTDDEWPYNLGE